MPSQHPGLGGGGSGGTAQAAPTSASTDYRTKSAAYIACACPPPMAAELNPRLPAKGVTVGAITFSVLHGSGGVGPAALPCRYLQDLKHQIGGKLVSLTPFDIESGPSSGSLSTKRRCGGAGRKCGWTGSVLITVLVVAILTMLIMRSHQQTSPSPPPPRLRPPSAGSGT